MKAADFNLQKDIQFSLETGTVTFRNNRMFILDANAMGLLRQDIIKAIGMDKARSLFLKFGYVHGYSDFMQTKLNYNFDDEMELLKAGPVLHTWEGLVKAIPKAIHFNREKGEFYFTGTWLNAFEAEQHLTFNPPASEPVCWTLMGYSAGWCSAFFGSKLISIEPLCVGKGDDHCEWEIQPPEAWDYEKAKPYIEALKEF